MTKEGRILKAEKPTQPQIHDLHPSAFRHSSFVIPSSFGSSPHAPLALIGRALSRFGPDPSSPVPSPARFGRLRRRDCDFCPGTGRAPALRFPAIVLRG